MAKAFKPSILKRKLDGIANEEEEVELRQIFRNMKFSEAIKEQESSKKKTNI